MIKAPKCWYVVADGARAAAYIRRDGRPGYDEVASWTSASAGQPARALGTDRPGRSVESLGGQRHGMEPRTDLKMEAKLDFAATVAQALNEARAGGAFEILVLYAPPRLIGPLKKELDGPTGEAVVRSIAKDMTKLPAKELFEAFREALAPA